MSDMVSRVLLALIESVEPFRVSDILFKYVEWCMYASNVLIRHLIRVKSP